MYRNSIPRWGSSICSKQKFIFNNSQNTTDNIHTKILRSERKLVNFAHNSLENKQDSKIVATGDTYEISESSKSINENMNPPKTLIHNYYDNNQSILKNSTDSTNGNDKLSLELYKKVTLYDDAINQSLGT